MQRTPIPGFPRRAPRLASVALLLAGPALLAVAPVRTVADPAEHGRPVLVRRPIAEAPAPSAADTARALHLLQRATFGARPQDLDEVLRLGPEAWLERQLHPGRIGDEGLERRLAAFPAAGMSVPQLYAAFPPPRPGDRPPPPPERGDSAQEMMMAPEEGGDANADRPRRPATREEREEMRRRRERSPQRIAFDLAGARLARAVHSEWQLEEVMTDFWFNHFNVFFGKNADRWLVGDYERTAIRPHVFGRFEEMLRATARHPAMLVYLDNWTSAAAGSSAGADPAARIAEARRRWRALTPAQRRRAVESGRVTPERAALLEADSLPSAVRNRRPRGLNENYARELLELHTLGVDGGYTQHDVVEVARAFTGWTIDPPRPRREAAGDGVGFVFRPAMHDRGEKVVLGRRLPAGRGREDGEEVLAMLARHPSTARHLAFKLAQRFVADEPPRALVDRLAETFLRTDGDLRAVTRALFLSPELDDPAHRGAKVKTPFEFVASALRATGAETGPSRGVLQALRQFGQVPYQAQAPTGYPHTSDEWTNGGALLGRMNFALALAAGRIDGVRVDARRLLPGGVPGGAEATVRALAAALLPGRADPALERTILADLAEHPELGPDQAAARALGLIVGSPAFQRR